MSLPKLPALALAMSAAALMTACGPAHNTNFTNYAYSRYFDVPRAVSADGAVIDLVSCTRGLPASMTTAKAGGSLLAVEGQIAAQPAPEAPAYVEPAPSVRGPVPVRGGLTTRLLTKAYEQTGRPYKKGGAQPAYGFDAAGFTRWVYGQNGVSLPRDVQRQASGGDQIAKEDLRPGDLLVYRDFAGQSGYHVGIYTGQGNFLHAAAKSGIVTETAAFDPQFAPYFVGARRYFDDPKATPLSDDQKMAAASSAVKTALMDLGPEDQPKRQAYAKPKAKTSVKAKKAKTSRKTAVKKTRRAAKKRK